MITTLPTLFPDQASSRKSRQLHRGRLKLARKGVKSAPLARLGSLPLALARFSSLGSRGPVKLVNARLSRAGNIETPRISLDYEEFFTLPLTHLNKKS
jgi:hypothetical protein